MKENQGSRSFNFLNWFVMIVGIYLFFFFENLFYINIYKRKFYNFTFKILNY